MKAKRSFATFLVLIFALTLLLLSISTTAFAAGSSVTLSNVSLTYGAPSYLPNLQKKLPMIVSNNGTVFTITDTAGEDFMNAANPSPYDNDFLLHFTANAKSLYSAKYNIPLCDGDQSKGLSLSMFVKSPYNTDPNYIIWTQTFYDHPVTSGDTSGTQFTVRVPKWESLYKPKIYYQRWYQFFIHGSRLEAEKFKPVSGEKNTFEYIAGTNVTFPHTINMLATNYKTVPFYVNGKLTHGDNKEVWAWSQNVVLTADKPYIDLKYVPPGNANTKYDTYVAATWRIRVTGKTDPSKPVAVSGISLNRSSYSFNKGQSMQLSATVLPSNATNKSVTWKSSKPSVATVDSNGKVKALGNGTARITATTNNGKTASCVVTVKTPAKAVTLDKTSATVSKGKTTQLSVKAYTPTSVYPKTITWKSGNTKIATVDSTGKVKGVKVGTTYIYAKTWNGVFAKCKITVKE